MRGRLSSLLGCILFIGLIFIAGSSPIEAKPNLKGELTFWPADRDNFLDIIEVFKEEYPNVKVNTIYIADKDNEHNKLYSMKSRKCESDVVELDTMHLKELMSFDNMFEDITKRASKISKKMVPYTLDVARDNNGQLRALSSFIQPCAIGYKRAIAKRYLGTDDPKKIEKMLSTPEKMLETAKILKDKSKGKVVLFPTYEEVRNIYFGQRKKSWLENGKITIDNKVLQYVDFSKKLAENKYEASKKTWSVEWGSAVSDEETMCWNIPSWGIRWIIQSNDKDTLNTGKWGIVKQSYPNFSDGSWYAINSKSKNKELAWEFIKFLTSNKRYLNKFVEKHPEYIPNNTDIIKLKSNSNEIDQVIGQNKYKVFGENLKLINGNICTQYDFDFERQFDVLLEAYIKGEIKTKNDLIGQFKKSAQATIDNNKKENQEYLIGK